MTEYDGGSIKPAQQAPSFRIWTVLSIALLIGTMLFIPWRIGSLGYMPQDDAGRHVGKAVFANKISSKSHNL